MNNAEYWRGRFGILEDAAHTDSVEYFQSLEREFKRASQSIQADIERWYGRFAGNNGISYLEAKKWLVAGQLEEFQWSVSEYIKAGESLNPQWLKQLENASARVHISRLEALQLQLQQQMEVLYGNHVDSLDDLLRKVYSNGYYHTAFEIQRGLNLGWDLQSLNSKQLQTILSRPWSTDMKTFRDRCWLNKAELVNTVHTQLVQSIMRGDSPDKMTKAIADRFNVSKNKAGRLTMTESAYFSAQAQRDCFNELDVENFEIVVTLDDHTCDVCGPLDGLVFPMADYEPGVTANPFHPWCRCCTAPHFDDDDGERAARDQAGKVYYVPANMKFNDWKRSFVDGGSKDDLTKIISNPYGWSTILGKHSLEEDAVAINPHYNKGFNYQQNCTHCVAAYEMRRRGLDVAATPIVPNDPYRFRAWRKIFDGSVWTHTKSSRKAGQASEIREAMLKWGEGARVEIRVGWDGARSGHVFAAEVRNGEVVFVDPQTGKTGVEYYFQSAKPSSVEYGRIDNLEATERIADVCMKRE